ncbi:hypothetical protein RB195_012833 [Necator americanus]|uniref:Uncharacterized protein n=1 Tax=Necator americanus TaxID=51031 RepID=A0ABR1DSR1_NECAM
MVKKLGQWLPHALSDGNRQRRLDICTQLLSRSRRFDWLDTVTRDEKWVLYVNHIQKRAWCTDDEMPDTFVKGEIHEKVMLSVWWKFMESTVLHCCPTTRQLLPRSTALNCKGWPTRSAMST